MLAYDEVGAFVDEFSARLLQEGGRISIILLSTVIYDDREIALIAQRCK